MFGEQEITTDDFLGGRLAIAQPATGYRAAADPVLLAAAVAARPGQSVLELGCGAGVASLCLGRRVAGLRLVGLELQPAYAALARRNAAANRQEFEVHEGDLAAMPATLRAQVFDHVIANPPYFGERTGTPARDPGRETAQREATPLAAWIGAGLRRLRPRGWLTLIHQAERLPEILAVLGTGAGGVTVLPVAPRQGREAGRVIVAACKGGRAPFRLIAPFILHDGEKHLCDGDDYSAAARAVLRDGAALSRLAR